LLKQFMGVVFPDAPQDVLVWPWDVLVCPRDI